MRVFLDTNVLVSAFATRGLCLNLFENVLRDHELIVSELVLAELRSVLQKKFGVPEPTLNEVDELLKPLAVKLEPEPFNRVRLPDPNDQRIVEFAIGSRADVLVTGDKEIFSCAGSVPGLQILNPREFWMRIVLAEST